jgi:hypothetical protein
MDQGIYLVNLSLFTKITFQESYAFFSREVFIFGVIDCIILQVSNIIFIDSPVGAGFSYATSEEGFKSSDTMAVKKLVIFLKKVSTFPFHTLPIFFDKVTQEVLYLPSYKTTLVPLMSSVDAEML